MSLLLVTAISVALRLRSPMQKNIAPSIEHVRAAQYMTPRGVATLAPCQLEGEVTKNAIAMNARTAAIRAWPNITIRPVRNPAALDSDVGPRSDRRSARVHCNSILRYFARKC